MNYIKSLLVSLDWFTPLISVIRNVDNLSPFFQTLPNIFIFNSSCSRLFSKFFHKNKKNTWNTKEKLFKYYEIGYRKPRWVTKLNSLHHTVKTCSRVFNPIWLNAIMCFPFYIKRIPWKGAEWFFGNFFYKQLFFFQEIPKKRKYFTICVKKNPCSRTLAVIKHLALLLKPNVNILFGARMFYSSFKQRFWKCSRILEPLFFLFAFYLCPFPGGFLVFLLIIYDPDFFVVPSFDVFMT